MYFKKGMDYVFVHRNEQTSKPTNQINIIRKDYIRNSSLKQRHNSNKKYTVKKTKTNKKRYIILHVPGTCGLYS